MSKDQADAGRAPDERTLLLDALRFPRGRYKAKRAAQLSGVPLRTVYDWARHRVLVPDSPHAVPKQWSYRDLVYVRLLVRLRALGMERDAASRRVAELRELVAAHAEQIDSIRITKSGVFLPGESYDRLTGQETIVELLDLTEHFNLLEPVAGVSEGPLWGPDLLHPSEHTYISPWVMGGEPCVNNTRIPAATVMTLVELRGLGTNDVLALYPSLTETTVKDAVNLERRLDGSLVAT